MELVVWNTSKGEYLIDCAMSFKVVVILVLCLVRIKLNVIKNSDKEYSMSHKDKKKCGNESVNVIHELNYIFFLLYLCRFGVVGKPIEIGFHTRCLLIVHTHF